MPNTFEGLIAFFGFLLTLASLFSGSFTWNGASLEALTGNKKRVVGLLGVSLLLVSTMLYTLDKFPSMLSGQQDKQALDRFEIARLLDNKGFTQYPELPIYDEVFKWKHQKQSYYQIKVCLNGSNERIAVPNHIDYCPAGTAKVSPRDGPIIRFSDYSD